MLTNELLLTAATISDRTGQAVQAELLYRRAILYTEQKHGDQSVQLAQVLMEFADFFEREKRLDEAEVCYLRMSKIVAHHLSQSNFMR